MWELGSDWNPECHWDSPTCDPPVVFQHTFSKREFLNSRLRGKLNFLRLREDWAKFLRMEFRISHLSSISPSGDNFQHATTYTFRRTLVLHLVIFYETLKGVNGGKCSIHVNKEKGNWDEGKAPNCCGRKGDDTEREMNDEWAEPQVRFILCAT